MKPATALLAAALIGACAENTGSQSPDELGQLLHRIEVETVL